MMPHWVRLEWSSTRLVGSQNNRFDLPTAFSPRSHHVSDLSTTA
jgi:hypothetical protein